MKTKLKTPPPRPAYYWQGNEAWEFSEPFIQNPRGWLIHRVRSITTRLTDDRKDHRHYTAHYYCGNRVRFYEPGKDLLAVPLEGRMVCAHCEEKAIAAAQKTSDELAGKHVHIGVMRPIRVCCQENKN